MVNTLIAAATVLLAIVALMLSKQTSKMEKRIKVLEKLWIDTEYRCPECNLREECPAAYSGVAYPCEYFAKEKET